MRAPGTGFVTSMNSSRLHGDASALNVEGRSGRAPAASIPRWSLATRRPMSRGT